MCAISVNSLLSGYLWLVGANYCTHSKIIFIAGAIGMGLWCGACMNCLVLVTNRLLDLWNKRIMLMFFKEKRTYLVCAFPVVYFLCFTFFTPPVLFNADRMAWFFATFADNHDIDMFYNYPHTANNLIIVVLTCILYVQYSRVLLRHHKAGSGLSWAQKSVSQLHKSISHQKKYPRRDPVYYMQFQFFIQSASICMANLIASLIYVYMQFLPTSPYFVLVGHLCWMMGHGFPAFVYLFLNRTIQREAFQLLGIKRTNTMRPIAAVTTSKSQPLTE
ncbi:unnamed protein product [Nippostrongylus brasiliensis]|uniref:7TM_GPCR_Srx domain-containing protein n=1 Tax=Nippostrongylus brasiliensis TaxID=27835 RepID=A0A158QY60_NIPBR|nr:unnamed protein product [Nippostrongylus brasiliensis]